MISHFLELHPRRHKSASHILPVIPIAYFLLPALDPSRAITSRPSGRAVPCRVCADFQPTFPANTIWALLGIIPQRFFIKVFTSEAFIMIDASNCFSSYLYLKLIQVRLLFINFFTKLFTIIRIIYNYDCLQRNPNLLVTQM